MAERELFVVCSNCGNEVSPYVTECPYCGTRLRKRAPDLKKQKKAEEKEERRAAKKRERLRAQYEGGGSAPGTWLETQARPWATGILVTAAIVASLLARTSGLKISGWMFDNLVLAGDLGANALALLTAPFLQYWFGYGFVCLGVFALFGAGIERRFGPIAAVAVWVAGGALGVLGEALAATSPLSYGAYGSATAAFVAWSFYVVNREDLRDHDAIGICAVAFVLCALPLATAAASVWTLVGGVIAGLLVGAVLLRLPDRS